MALEIKVPTLGESVTEATVGQWFKKEGDAVQRDEPLVELETDKVTVEVPAPIAGRLDLRRAAHPGRARPCQGSQQDGALCRAAGRGGDRHGPDVEALAAA